jgi:hypothetical protein
MNRHRLIGATILAFALAPAGAVIHAQGSAPTAAPQAPVPPPNTPFRLIATVQQLMLAVLEPTSNAVFRVEVEAPNDTREWNAVTNAALALAEAGNLLMLPGRARDSEGWMRHAQSLVDVSVAAMKAAEARNAEKVVAIGYEINDVCRNCHVQYKPRTRPSLPR